MVCLMIMAGCTWTHPYKTQQQYYEDRAFCQAQGGQANPGGYGPDVGVFMDCMQGRGWTLERQR